MNREEYKKYLQSKEWAQVKRDMEAKTPKRCAVCSSTEKVHLHHMRYRQDFANTRLKDLCWLCEACHTVYHQARKVPKRHDSRKLLSHTRWTIEKERKQTSQSVWARLPQKHSIEEKQWFNVEKLCACGRVATRKLGTRAWCKYCAPM